MPLRGPPGVRRPRTTVRRVSDPSSQPDDGLLGPAAIRDLAATLGVRPSKTWGQNFVVDPNTVRRIVRRAAVGEADTVLEVGPGPGSLTLGLLDVCPVVAVEIDPVLAEQLPRTVRQRRPDLAPRLTVRNQDALTLTPADLPGLQPTALVANLPYNVAVPVLLTLLERFGSLARVLVMVQAEVADRLAAGPGSKVYGAPSAKVAWYCHARRAGDISRSVFWPVPNVDSALVALTRRPEPGSTAGREAVFAVIDAAFAQRRKTLRAALAGWAGSAARAEDVLRRAGVDPGVRGERLDVEGFVAIADAARRVPSVNRQAKVRRID